MPNVRYNVLVSSVLLETGGNVCSGWLTRKLAGVKGSSLQRVVAVKLHFAGQKSMPPAQ